jgi:hypothetical protein
MIPARNDEKGIAFRLIHQAVLMIDASGPEAGQFTFKWLRLASACKRRAQALLQKLVDFTQNGFVCLLPILIMTECFD